MNPDNLQGLKKTKEWRKYLMGPEIFEQDELQSAAFAVYDRIEGHGPYTQYSTFGELIHELAHHITLRGHLRLRRRRFTIEDEIYRMGIAAQEGNELDTLAVDLEALWWLGHPESQWETARLTGISMFKPRQIHKLLTYLRESPEIQEWGVTLARAIQRRARANRKKQRALEQKEGL